MTTNFFFVHFLSFHALIARGASEDQEDALDLLICLRTTTNTMTAAAAAAAKKKKKKKK
jgi:hypothetical protein